MNFLSNPDYRRFRPSRDSRMTSRRLQSANRERSRAARRRRAELVGYPTVFRPGTGFPVNDTRSADTSLRVHPRKTAEFRVRSPRRGMNPRTYDRINANRRVTHNMRTYGLPINPHADPYNRAYSDRLGDYVGQLRAAGAYMSRGDY